MNVPHHIAMDPPLVQSLTKDDPWADDDSCILAAKEEVEAIDALMANSSFIDASERCAEAENIVSHYEEGTPGFSYVNVSKFSLFLAELSFRDAQCYEKITRLPLIRTPPDAEIIYELFNWMFRSCMRAIKNCQRAEASSRAGELMAEIKVFMKEVFVETDDSGDDSGDDSVHEISSPGLYWW